MIGWHKDFQDFSLESSVWLQLSERALYFNVIWSMMPWDTTYKVWISWVYYRQPSRLPKTRYWSKHTSSHIDYEMVFNSVQVARVDKTGLAQATDDIQRSFWCLRRAYRILLAHKNVHTKFGVDISTLPLLVELKDEVLDQVRYSGCVYRGKGRERKKCYQGLTKQV